MGIFNKIRQKPNTSQPDSEYSLDAMLNSISTLSNIQQDVQQASAQRILGEIRKN